MKIQSMTGYGKAEVRTSRYYAGVEIKSINNRFFEVQFRLPKNLLALEPKFKNILESVFRRGSFFCYIQYEIFKGVNSEIRLNQGLLREYLAIIRKIAAENPGKFKVDLAEFMKIPELVQVLPLEADMDKVKSDLLPVFKRAAGSLKRMRLNEGDKLVADIRSRVLGFSGQLKEIKALLPARQKAYTLSMKSRVGEILGKNLAMVEERVMTELGIMAEKLDVTEELVRFESHIRQFIDTLKTKEAPGKKLGFLQQEMFREITTLSTKSQYVDIQHKCVTIKDELEKIREQLQNIE